MVEIRSSYNMLLGGYILDSFQLLHTTFPSSVVDLSKKINTMELVRANIKYFLAYLRSEILYIYISMLWSCIKRQKEKRKKGTSLFVVKLPLSLSMTLVGEFRVMSPN